MLFTPPSGVTFHTERALGGDDLVTVTRRVIAFLEESVWTPDELRIYDDRWEKDGRRFERKRVTYAGLAAMTKSARAMLDAMPDDDCVKVGVAPEGNEWYLRFRAARGETAGEAVGTVAVVLSRDAATLFRLDVQPRCEPPLSEAPSKSYFARVRA